MIFNYIVATGMSDYEDDEQVDTGEYECMIDTTRKIRRRSAQVCQPGYDNNDISLLLLNK